MNAWERSSEAAFAELNQRFPLFRLSVRLTRTAAPSTKTSNKASEYSKTGKKLSGVCCLMSSSSSLVKLIEID